MKTSGFRVRVGRVPKWTRAYIQVACKKCSYMTHSYRETEAFTKSLRSGVTTGMEGGYTTKGPCATRGLLRGPLVLVRSVRPAGIPRAASRVSLTEVLLDGRRAPAYASADLASTLALPEI